MITGDDPICKGVRRFEVITGVGQRKDWSNAVKATILAQCWPGGEKVLVIGRAHGLVPSPIYNSRKELARRCEDKACLCWGGALHQIGEDVAERLDVVPTTFRVLVTRRPRYGRRSCENAVVQAPAPARIVEGSIPSEALIAQSLVSKHADQLPLYRQAQIYARRGMQLDRSTLADWVGRAAWYLRSLLDHILERLRRSNRLFADETTALVLDAGRKRTKAGQIWAYACNDRPWGRSDPPMVVYVDAAGRNTERPEAHLHGFASILQLDGYSTYAALARRHQQNHLAFCWALMRRKFYELAESSLVAANVLRRIASPYAIEDDIHGLSADERRDACGQRSRPIVDDLYRFLEARERQVSAKNRLAEAIRYTLPPWDGLVRFLDDGRIDLDINAVERAPQPLALYRKDPLFDGSDEGGDNWAAALSGKVTEKFPEHRPSGSGETAWQSQLCMCIRYRTDNGPHP